ncbi:hypothetical protein Q3G72_013615 [Acer saccharum]|nr:hypothetical protein Q3G72_013615 [Acer saccharum]
MHRDPAAQGRREGRSLERRRADDPIGERERQRLPHVAGVERDRIVQPETGRDELGIEADVAAAEIVPVFAEQDERGVRPDLLEVERLAPAGIADDDLGDEPLARQPCRLPCGGGGADQVGFRANGGRQDPGRRAPIVAPAAQVDAGQASGRTRPDRRHPIAPGDQRLGDPRKLAGKILDDVDVATTHGIIGLVDAGRPPAGRALAADIDDRLRLVVIQRRGLDSGDDSRVGADDRQLLNIALLQPDRLDKGDQRGAAPGRSRLLPGAMGLGVGHGDGARRESGDEHLPGLIGDPVAPQHAAAATRSRRRAIGERIDRAVVLAHRQVDVRELGVARQADQPQPRRGAHPLPRLHADAALGEVAILGFPAMAVVDDEAVAAFLVGDGCGAALAHRDVGHAVAHAQHAAGRAGQHGDALVHSRQAGDAEIGAVMPRIGAATAQIVVRRRGGAGVDIVLHRAIAAQVAGER